MYEFAPGATGQSIQYLLRDALTGQPKIGLSYLTPGGVAGYVRQNGSAVAVPLAQLLTPLDPWTAGGFVEVDPALVPGVYRFDPPDSALAAGAAFTTLAINFDGTFGEGVLVLLRNPVNNVGAGALQYTITLVNGSAMPVQGGSLWVTTDSGGSNVIAGSLTSDTLGQATFLLSDGTYYLWVNAVGYTVTNPTAFTVSGAGGQTVTLAAASAPPSLAGDTTHEPATTAHDLRERLLDFVGSDADEKNYRAVNRALLDALREYAVIHKWTALRTFGRISMNGAYSGNGTGSVEYQMTSGTYPMQLTLTGDTWPSWAAAGYVRIGVVVAKIDKRVSDTVLTLKDPVFQTDLAAGQPFTLYRDTYTLPSDFVFTSDAMAETSWGTLTYMGYDQWLGRVRFGQNVAYPQFWTVGGDPDHPGRLAMLVYPAPDTDMTLDYFYYRRPRQVTNFDLTDGTVSVDGSNPNLLTFSKPILKASMVGSVVRLADDQSGPPTGIEGLSPYVYEGGIVTVISTTQATVDASASTDLVNVSYRLSDPVEAVDLHMTLVARAAEKNLAMSRTMQKVIPLAENTWREALTLAMEGDSRVSSRRGESVGGHRRLRLARMPISFNDP